MSTFAVEVVPVHLEPHPNADSLSLVNVYGYQVVVRTADWQEGQLAAYIPPDSVVPDAPEYAFLAAKPEEGLREKDRRIKVRRFRGVYSQGLLVPAPPGAKAGENVAGLLGVTHYEPPLQGLGTGGQAESPPVGIRPDYDVEHYKRHGHLLRLGEPVLVTEKLHGTNARFTFQDGRFYCGSHHQWKRFPEGQEKNVWWECLHRYPAITHLLLDNPGLTIYGEIYGDIQDLTYGHGKGQFSFAAFDIWQGPHAFAGPVRRLLDRIARHLGYIPEERGAGWMPVMDARALCTLYDVPWVPVLREGPFTPELAALAEGQSTLADHVREGCVIRPLVERNDPSIGRVQLKAINNAYLERAV